MALDRYVTFAGREERRRDRRRPAEVQTLGKVLGSANHVFLDNPMQDSKRTSTEELEERERTLAQREKLTLKKLEELAEREAVFEARVKDLKRRERAVAQQWLPNREGSIGDRDQDGQSPDR